MPAERAESAPQLAGLDGVLELLACPHCGAALERHDRVLRCGNGHSFDIARQGYVSLLGPRSRTDTADTAEMVAARVDFLDRGHYAPIAAALIAAVVEGGRPSPERIVEVGAGTGYYLASVLAACAGAVGAALDSSARACRRAAGLPRVGAVVADAWSTLPIAETTADTVLSVFAPRQPAELARILAPAGRLIVVTPTVDHLAELIGPLGMLSVDREKDRRLAASFDGHFVPVGSTRWDVPLNLDHDDLRALVLMGPAARHVNRTTLDDAIGNLPDRTDATASVTVSAWSPIVI